MNEKYLIFSGFSMRELKDSKSLIYFATSAQNNTKSRADGEKTMENGALKGAERELKMKMGNFLSISPLFVVRQSCAQRAKIKGKTLTLSRVLTLSRNNLSFAFSSALTSCTIELRISNFSTLIRLESFVGPFDVLNSSSSRSQQPVTRPKWTYKKWINTLQELAIS